MIITPSGRKLGRGASLFFAEGGLADEAAFQLFRTNVCCRSGALIITLNHAQAAY